MFGISNKTLDVNDSFYSCNSNEIKNLEIENKNLKDKSKIFRGYLLYDQKFKNIEKLKEERKKKEDENKKRIKSQDEIEADKIKRVKREQENITRCLIVAESNQKYIQQKDQKIKEIKEREHNSFSEASKLKSILQKSKKSYSLNNSMTKKSNLSKINSLGISNISTSTNISNKSLPLIPKLNLSESPTLKDAAVPASLSNNSINLLKTNPQSNTEMLVYMRQRLIKNLTSRDEDYLRTSTLHNQYANIQTERTKDKTIQPGFMNPTQSKKQYMIDKVDDLTTVTKELQKHLKKTKKTQDIVKRNKIVKVEYKKPVVMISAQDELKYLKKNTVNFLIKFFKQEFDRLINTIQVKRKKIEELYHDDNSAFMTEAMLNPSDFKLSPDFEMNHLTYSEYIYMMFELHFLSCEDDKMLALQVFSALKRDKRLDCMNINDLLKVMLFVLGYTNYNEVEILQESFEDNEYEILNQDSIVWETFKKNRAMSTKKTPLKPEKHSFKPQTNNNITKNNKTPLVDRCLDWNQKRNHMVEIKRKDKQDLLKKIEDNFINHKLEVNASGQHKKGNYCALTHKGIKDKYINVSNDSQSRNLCIRLAELEKSYISTSNKSPRTQSKSISYGTYVESNDMYSNFKNKLNVSEYIKSKSVLSQDINL